MAIKLFDSEQVLGNKIYSGDYTYMGVVFIFGMFDKEIMSRFRPKVMLNSALKLGSSKQGKTLRASTGSI